jgi:phosphoribosyl 1,2-cyclic phosphodiesterase
MRVIIWGCRGSIPVSGRQFIKYGGSTTCVEVVLQDGSELIFDAGTGIRNLGRRILQEPKVWEMTLFLTHPHWDHLMGFPFFQPAYSDRYRIHVRGGPIAKETLRRYLEQQMQAPYFPARFDVLKAEFDFTSGIPIVQQVGKAQVIPIPLNHPGGGYGFKVVDGQSTLVFLTDNELAYDHNGGRDEYEYMNFAKDADLLLHDGQYSNEEYAKRRGWGHSPFMSVIELAVKARVKRLGILHHDPDHDDNDLDQIGKICTRAAESGKSLASCFVVREGQEIKI